MKERHFHVVVNYTSRTPDGGSIKHGFASFLAKAKVSKINSDFVNQLTETAKDLFKSNELVIVNWIELETE